MTELTVVKVGGNEVEDTAWIERLVNVVAGRSAPCVLVHGGGREITRLQRQLGAEPEWRDGLRVTTPEALDAVRMVLSGTVNKRLVAALIGAGVDAIGISGEDAGLLRAIPARGGALGRTGEIVSVRTELLEWLLGRGLLPVVAPVSRGENGDGLNVNADDAAAAIAAALGAAELLFVSDVGGVRGSDGTLAEIAADEAETLIAGGIAAGGMAPKLRAAVRAGSRVERVRIGGLEMIDNPAAGTRVRADRPLAQL